MRQCGRACVCVSKSILMWTFFSLLLALVVDSYEIQAPVPRQRRYSCHIRQRDAAGVCGAQADRHAAGHSVLHTYSSLIENSFIIAAIYILVFWTCKSTLPFIALGLCGRNGVARNEFLHSKRRHQKKSPTLFFFFLFFGVHVLHFFALNNPSNCSHG